MLRKNVHTVVAILLALAVGGQAEFQVNTYAHRDQIQPAVAVNDAGDFAVLWRSHVADGRGGGVHARCFAADGTAYGDEFQVNTSEADVSDWAPAVAMSPSGTIVALWVTDENGPGNIAARMFDVQGTPLTDEWRVSPTSKIAQSTPSIAMNAGGTFVVVWTTWLGSTYIGRHQISGRLFDPEGIAIGGEFQIADHGQAVGPDVAMDESGRFVVTWMRLGDTYNRPYGEYVMVRQYQADGMPCNAAIQLTGDLRSRWYTPSVAAGLDGRFVLTWAMGPFPYDIYAQSFDSTCGLIDGLCMINTVIEGNQGHPRVTTDGQGDYLIVWDSHDSDGAACVCGQLFTQDCTLPGDQMLFSAPTGRLNWYPDAAMAPNGRYVVTWIGQAGDSESGYDIFAQTGSL